MITIKTDVIRPQINKSVITRHAARAADDIALSVANNVKITLARAGKTATFKTQKSIKAERVLDSPSRGEFRRSVTGARSWLNIQYGRRAGGKMPVTRNGGKFEPVPELLEWFTALNIPRNRWFPIMRNIARRGIKPVNIRDRAVNMSRQRISEVSNQTAARIAADLFTK